MNHHDEIFRKARFEKGVKRISGKKSIFYSLIDKI